MDIERPNIPFFHKAIGSVLGAGYAPIAPGTVGALVAAIAWWLLVVYWPAFGAGVGWQLLLILIACGIGTWSADQLEYIWGEDPSRVVIDELVGMWISLLMLPLSVWTLGLGFLFFRVFDIFKPLGVKKGEQLPGGFGIMADDVIAGIYTNFLLQLLLALGWLPNI